MKKTRRHSAARLRARVAITLGELISAAYDAADGFGNQKLERAAQILSSARLARRLSPHVQFIR